MRLTNFKDISPFRIAALAKFYEISSEFLMEQTNKKHPNKDLHDLHLRDDLITVLKSGKINSQLLCEIAGHSIRDIRKVHRADAATADVASPTAEAQKKLQEAIRASNQEKQCGHFLLPTPWTMTR